MSIIACVEITIQFKNKYIRKIDCKLKLNLKCNSNFFITNRIKDESLLLIPYFVIRITDLTVKEQ